MAEYIVYQDDDNGQLLVGLERRKLDSILYVEFKDLDINDLNKYWKVEKDSPLENSYLYFPELEGPYKLTASGVHEVKKISQMYYVKINILKAVGRVEISDNTLEKVLINDIGRMIHTSWKYP